MDPLLKKLNVKEQTAFTLLNAPSDLVALRSVFQTARQLNETVPTSPTPFLLGFARTLLEVEKLAEIVQEHVPGDELVWIAYPKGSSKRYECEFNRDTGWEAFGARGFEPVRQIAIDDDWSALRFRRVGYIKAMTRSFAMTEEGNKKSGKS